MTDLGDAITDLINRQDRNAVVNLMTVISRAWITTYEAVLTGSKSPTPVELTAWLTYAQSELMKLSDCLVQVNELSRVGDILELSKKLQSGAVEDVKQIIEKRVYAAAMKL